MPVERAPEIEVGSRLAIAGKVFRVAKITPHTVVGVGRIIDHTVNVSLELCGPPPNLSNFIFEQAERAARAEAARLEAWLQGLGITEEDVGEYKLHQVISDDKSTSFYQVFRSDGSIVGVLPAAQFNRTPH